MEPLRLDVLLNASSQLPSSKNVVWELLRLLDHEDVTAAQILEVLHGDQGLITRLLRLANSPFFGVSRQVGSAQDAMVVLGLMNVRRIAIATSLLDSEHEGLRDYWQHSLRIASLSEVVAKKAGVSTEASFLSGLLRHLGLLMFLEYDPDYANRLILNRAHSCELARIEQETHGFDHIRLAATLVERWHFPPQITEAISLNYSVPPQAISLVALTNHIADLWVEYMDSENQDSTCFVLPGWLFTALALDAAVQPTLITELSATDEVVKHLMMLM
ncbi:HDOD domain-containing protein [Chitinimonas sp. BJB300]|uniref:HDOD domain-containing protein n=1 Tax=Chitinimonas sp. BJB300 TaxID=1559339 RepID=UPI00130424D9|nr:HDOD domain-containing protein [Chitinimonas sp. BJB300]